MREAGHGFAEFKAGMGNEHRFVERLNLGQMCSLISAGKKVNVFKINGDDEIGN